MVDGMTLYFPWAIVLAVLFVLGLLGAFVGAGVWDILNCKRSCEEPNAHAVYEQVCSQAADPGSCMRVLQLQCQLNCDFI